MFNMPLLRTFACIAAAVLTLWACTGTDYKTGFDNLMQSVVKIDVWEAPRGASEASGGNTVGSGVIISPDGYIVTNAHVVNIYAEKIIVTLPCLERAEAKLIGWDHWTDIALIKVDVEELKNRGISLQWAHFGDSDAVKSPDEVYAVGTPFGCARTVTRGIISNNKRYFDGEIDDNGYETGLFNTWLQTDAAINPGNSGGPLALPDGRVIGINTRAAIMSNNLGFAVPSNVVKDVVQRLKSDAKIERAYTGISLTPAQDIKESASVTSARGALIKSVDRGSPADLAGIASGDLIVKIDGESVDGRYPEQLPAIMHKISQKPIGAPVEFEILRGGNIFRKSVKTELLESRIGRKYALADWGAEITQITKALRREKKLSCDSSAMVSDVRAGYPFALAGISGGEIILAIGKRKINTCADVEDEYKKLKRTKQKVLVKTLLYRTINYHILNLGQ